MSPSHWYQIVSLDVYLSFCVPESRVNTATALVESKLNYKITSLISMFIVLLSVVSHRANPTLIPGETTGS